MRQGELYWLRFGGQGSEPSGRIPAMVIQHDRFNRSAIQTTIVAAVTANLKMARVPGNVRLKKGEANLALASVINMTQIRTIDRSRLDERIGTLSPRRIHQVLARLSLVFGFDDVEPE